MTDEPQIAEESTAEKINRIRRLIKDGTIHGPGAWDKMKAARRDYRAANPSAPTGIPSRFGQPCFPVNLNRLCDAEIDEEDAQHVD